MSAVGPPGGGADGRASAIEEFAAFYREAAPHVIRRIARNGYAMGIADATDIAQDAFTAAFEAWDRIRQFEFLEAYVHKVAERLAYRRGKRAAREVPMPDVSGLSACAPDEASEMLEELDSVTKMIGQLPKRQAATVVLKMRGATTEEIARELDADPSTVRSNLRHARARLTEIMDAMAREDECPPP